MEARPFKINEGPVWRVDDDHGCRDLKHSRSRNGTLPSFQRKVSALFVISGVKIFTLFWYALRWYTNIERLFFIARLISLLVAVKSFYDVYHQKRKHLFRLMRKKICYFATYYDFAWVIYMTSICVNGKAPVDAWRGYQRLWTAFLWNKTSDNISMNWTFLIGEGKGRPFYAEDWVFNADSRGLPLSLIICFCLIYEEEQEVATAGKKAKMCCS